MLLLRATRGACNPNLNVAIEHARHACRMMLGRFCGLPLRMNGMNSTQFDHVHLSLDDTMTGNVMSSVLIFDQKTFDLVARAALFIFESSGRCIFKGFYISKLDHLTV